MKTITNEEYTIAVDQNGSKATAATIIGLVLGAQPQGGFDFKTMRTRLKIVEKLEKVDAGEKIELEDAEFSEVKKAAETYRWGVMSPDLIRFAALLGL